jgi:hypothetical protein
VVAVVVVRRHVWRSPAIVLDLGRVSRVYRTVSPFCLELSDDSRMWVRAVWAVRRVGFVLGDDGYSY